MGNPLTFGLTAVCLVWGAVDAVAQGAFYAEVAPEVRTTYQSLGKIVEDRPMQITSVRFGLDTEGITDGWDFGRIGVRNWDVSSLTDRRADVHRHALYHTEFGPTWTYDLRLADGWKLTSELTRSWTIYRGSENPAGDKTYHWWQFDQVFDNPWLVPFYRIRRCFRPNDYLYFKVGVRRRFPLFSNLYVTPSVFAEGGSARNYKRVFGARTDGGDWSDGVSSVSFRIEVGWTAFNGCTVFGYVEQYEVTGGAARDANASGGYLCAHNDWTHGGIGVRMKF